MDEQVVGQRHPRRKLGGSDELHAHDVMDTPGCGRVSPWHARRCMRAAGSRRWRSSPCSGRRSSWPSTAAAATSARRARWAPSVVGGVAAAQPFTYVPAAARRLRARRRARPQPRALRQEPGRRRGLGPAHRALAADRRPRRPRHGLDADMLEAIVMLESAGRADARASDDLRLGRGADPDPRRDRPEPARPADRRQGLRAPHARHPARPPRAPARGAAPARRRALRPGQGDRGAPRATSTSPRASSGATTSPSSPTTWASATCSRR